MPPLDFKIKQPGATLMVALSAAFPLTGMAANAGRIDFASGDVQALAPDGRSRTLTKGATFDSGETIETGGNGRAQLRFTDGAQVSLQPKSQFRIDDYNFSGKPDGSEKGLFSLLKGGLRTITGWVGRTNRDNYKVTTAVATIGIRGTEYSVTYGNSITVTTGEGVIEICNTAGCMILNSGETAHVPNNDTRPSMIDKKADLPPPPPSEELPFSVAENTNSSGSSSVIAGEGSGSYQIMLGLGDDGSGVSVIGAGGPATFSGATLTHIGLPEYYAMATGASSGNWDGTIGWGYWSSGEQFDGGFTSSFSDVHYIIGLPTPAAEISSLSGSVPFSLLGATPPSFTGSSPGTIITGSLAADFTNSTVSWSLGLSGGTYPSITGSGIISSSVIGGTATFTTSTASGSFSGLFVGSNAARAGLTYEIQSGTHGTVWGAAAFTQ